MLAEEIHMKDDLGFSEAEWQEFSLSERRIIMLARKYNYGEDYIRAVLTFPEEPMSKRTFQNHKARLLKKMSKIRLARSCAE